MLEGEDPAPDIIENAGNQMHSLCDPSRVAGKPSTATGIHDGGGRNVGYLCQGTETAGAATPQGDNLNTAFYHSQGAEGAVMACCSSRRCEWCIAFCYHGQGGKYDDSVASRGCGWCLFCW